MATKEVGRLAVYSFFVKLKDSKELRKAEGQFGLANLYPTELPFCLLP